MDNFQAEVDDAFETLESALKLSEGFKLYFVICGSVEHQRSTLARLWKTNRYRLVELRNLGQPIFDQVMDVAGRGSSPLMVSGLNAFVYPGAAEAGALQDLNMSRPRWPRQFQRPVLFWIDRATEQLVAKYAPDFYRFRSTTIEFPYPESKAQQRVVELAERLETVNAPPHVRMQWLWEIGLNELAERGVSLAVDRAVQIAVNEGISLPPIGLDQVIEIDLFLPSGTNLKPLERLSRLMKLEILGYSINQADYLSLKQLRSLSILGLDACGVEDKDLLQLIALPKLTSLSLDHNQIMGETLSLLSVLAHLRHLSLAECPLNSDYLIHLAKLKSLKFLDLSFSGIEAQSLDALAEVKGLTRLILTGNGFTKDDIGNLQQRLPKCRIAI